MTVFFSKYTNLNFKDSSIFYWPSNYKDYKYKFNNVIINCVKDQILKKKIFYSNNGFKYNSYFNKEHFVNNYLYSIEDKKLNVIFPQNVFKKKLKPFIGFFYTLESDFFTSKIQTVEYYKYSCKKFKIDQKFISSFKKSIIKQNFNYAKFKFNLIIGNTIKPYINKFEKEYKKLYTFVPFKKFYITCSNSKVFDYEKNNTSGKKKWWPASVWKEHKERIKIVLLMKHNGILLNIVRSKFQHLVYGSLAPFIKWKIRQAILHWLIITYKFLMFCGKLFTLNKPSKIFIINFIAYKSYLNVLWHKVRKFFDTKNFPFDPRGKYRKPIIFNKTNYILTRALNQHKIWKKTIYFITKLINNIFKSEKKYKGTVLHLFRNKEIYNYITDIRIFQKEYDYWDEDNKPFEDLLKSDIEDSTYAMHRKIFYYYKLNEIVLNPKPAFWTLKSLLKEYYILKYQYLHNFIENKLLISTYLKQTFVSNNSFSFFLVNIYYIQHLNNLENFTYYKNHIAILKRWNNYIISNNAVDYSIYKWEKIFKKKKLRTLKIFKLFSYKSRIFKYFTSNFKYNKAVKSKFKNKIYKLKLYLQGLKIVLKKLSLWRQNFSENSGFFYRFAFKQYEINSEYAKPVVKNIKQLFDFKGLFVKKEVVNFYLKLLNIYKIQDNFKLKLKFKLFYNFLFKYIFKKTNINYLNVLNTYVNNKQLITFISKKINVESVNKNFIKYIYLQNEFLNKVINNLIKIYKNLKYNTINVKLNKLIKFSDLSLNDFRDLLITRNSLNYKVQFKKNLYLFLLNFDKFNNEKKITFGDILLKDFKDTLKPDFINYIIFSKNNNEMLLPSWNIYKQYNLLEITFFSLISSYKNFNPLLFFLLKKNVIYKKHLKQLRINKKFKITKIIKTLANFTISKIYRTSKYNYNYYIAYFKNSKVKYFRKRFSRYNLPKWFLLLYEPNIKITNILDKIYFFFNEVKNFKKQKKGLKNQKRLWKYLFSKNNNKKKKKHVKDFLLTNQRVFKNSKNKKI